MAVQFCPLREQAGLGPERSQDPNGLNDCKGPVPGPGQGQLSPGPSWSLAPL